MILTAYVASKQRRPRGPFRSITPWWQDSVRDRLDELEWHQDDLAEKVGCSAGAITGLLKPGATQSRLVEPVSKLLDIPMPEYKDEREADLLETLREIREMSADEFDRLEARVKRARRDLEKDSNSD